MANNLGGFQNIFNMLGSGGNAFSGLRKILGMNGNMNNKEINSNNRGYRCRYKILTMEEAYIGIMAGNYKVLDVRSENEYKVLRIKGAINLPVDMVFSNIYNVIPNKQECILIYCATGVRAARAIQMLANQGYINLCIWEGGGINNFKYKDIIISNVQTDGKST